jgi:hypothetical protein
MGGKYSVNSNFTGKGYASFAKKPGKSQLF